MPKIMINDTVKLFFSDCNLTVILSHDGFRVLLDKIASVLFYLKIHLYFRTGNGQPGRETSTVAIVSAHFRSQLHPNES